MTSLAGRVVLVTGAGRGLGRSLAVRLAREGAAVAVSGRSADRLGATCAEIAACEVVAAAGGRAFAVTLDVTSEAGVAAGVAAAEAALGPLDGLVANSGIAGPTAPVWEVTPAQWAETMEVNLAGVFRCCRVVLGGMVARGRGSVVVVGSVTGARPLAGRTPYAASKLALVGLVRTAALDTAAYGVRVNLVAPGPIDGERLRRVVAAQALARGVSEEQALADLVAPSTRPVTTDEVADVVTDLLAEASTANGEDVDVR